MNDQGENKSNRSYRVRHALRKLAGAARAIHALEGDEPTELMHAIEQHMVFLMEDDDERLKVPELEALECLVDYDFLAAGPRLLLYGQHEVPFDDEPSVDEVRRRLEGT